MTRIYDFTYTGGDSGVHSQVQQYDRLDRAVSQVQYYFDSVRAWRHDVVSYATQARQDRDHIKTLGDTIASTGQHIDTKVQVAIDAAETSTTAASNTATDRKAAQTARTGAETAETNAKTHATDAASSASSAADVLAATEALGITVDTSVGTRVFVGDTMIYGSVGLRDITGLVIEENGWDLSFNARIRVSRSNNTVELEITSISHPDASGWTTLLNLPSGFRPISGYFWGDTYRGASARVTSGGAVQVSNPVSQVDYISFVFSVTNIWPTTTPGTPA